MRWSCPNTLPSAPTARCTSPHHEDEAVKNYTRLRTPVDALKKAKQNLLSFLLRSGRVFSEGRSYWTHTHYAWLKRQQFTDPVDQETFNEYLQEVYDQQDKVDRYNQRIEQLSQLEAYREKVARLRCFRGIETHTALSLVSEIGISPGSPTPSSSLPIWVWYLVRTQADSGRNGEASQKRGTPD